MAATPHWVYVIAEQDGSEVADLVGARDRRMSWRIDAPATVTWTTTGDDPGALEAHELRRDLIVYRDGQKMFRGRIGATSDRLDTTGHTVTWSAVDYRGLLARRIIWQGPPSPGPALTRRRSRGI